MKKGQKIRILKDNSIGTIVDSTFFTLGGKKQIRYQVRKSEAEAEPRWYPADQLGPVTETVKVTIAGSNNQALFADLTINYLKGGLNMKVTGSPDNLKEHKGAHVRIMSCFIDHLNDM